MVAEDAEAAAEVRLSICPTGASNALCCYNTLLLLCKDTNSMRMGAIIDATGTYRYSLWREWDANAPRVCFVMLNPSTADATTDDPTIRRCIRFAQFWGYGSLEVVNLFAYRTTTPIDLRHAPNPIGKENDRYCYQASLNATKVIVAWGNWGGLLNRNQTVLNLLFHQQEIDCLGITKPGHPRHPLYIRSNTVPIRYSWPSTVACD